MGPPGLQGGATWTNSSASLVRGQARSYQARPNNTDIDRWQTDSLVRACGEWLGEHFRRADAIEGVVEHSGTPERTFEHRLKAATGTSPTEYLQRCWNPAPRRWTRSV